ncbi:MAG: hypothetical protein K6G07_04050 [Lachnospiraceae bacterium]|nr:hypothetical protein [Lachnospiraceae bacterium]
MDISSLSGYASYRNETYIKPLEYTLSNQSDTSQAFKESLKSTNPGAVSATKPVRYADAQAYATPTYAAVAHYANAQKVSQAFNEIARSYAGLSTGYSNQGDSTAYSAMVGSLFDAYA